MMTWIITALVGAILAACFCVALLLIFRFPRKVVRIGPLCWSGLLPFWVGNHLKKHLIDLFMELKPQEQVENVLRANSTRDQVIDWLQGQVNHYLSTTLPEKWPMLSLLIGDKTQEKVRSAITDQVHSNWHVYVDQISHAQLSPNKLQAYLTNVIRLDQPEIWSDAIWKSVKRRIPGFLLLSLLVGSIMALMGRILYGCLVGI